MVATQSLLGCPPACKGRCTPRSHRGWRYQGACKGDDSHVPNERGGLNERVRGAHRHHVPAAGHQVLHHHDHGLFLPQPPGLDVEALAGGRAPAGGREIQDHRLYRVVTARVVQVLAYDVGRVLVDDRVGNVDDPDVGSSGRYVDEDQRACRYPEADQDRHDDQPGGQCSFHGGKHRPF